MNEAAPDWLDTVRRVVAAVRESDVSELELRHNTFSLRVRRQPGMLTVRHAAHTDGRDEEPDTSEAHLHGITAPLTGIFYRAASPTEKPYAQEGDWVEADAVVGLVETMKIFNEVSADRAGTVVRFLAESGQLVQAGDRLLLLEPGDRPTMEDQTHG